MGRQWCRTTDPQLFIDGIPHALILGADVDARGHLQQVMVYLNLETEFEVRGEGHKFLGIPIEVRDSGLGSEHPMAVLEILADGEFACSLEISPRGRHKGLELFGAGLTNEPVEALPVVSE